VEVAQDLLQKIECSRETDEVCVPVAEKSWREIDRNQDVQRPLVFIAHGLGAVIVKEVSDKVIHNAGTSPI